MDFGRAVIGVFGLHAYGLSRGTFDLGCAADSAAQPWLVASFESLGYETLHVSAGYSNHLHAMAALGGVDVVYVSARFGEMEDIRFILTLPGIDEPEVRGSFGRAGLRDRYDEPKRLG